MKNNHIIILVALSLAGWILIGSGCDNDHSDKDGQSKHADAEGRGNPDDPTEHKEEIIRLTPQELKEFGIEVAVAGPGSLKMNLSLPGEIKLNADLADRTAHIGPGVNRGNDEDVPELASERFLGLRVEDLTARLLQEVELPRDTTGVIVTRVSRVSEAYQKGIGEGDIITEVNREAVEDVGEYRRVIRKVDEGGLVVLYVINPPSRTGGDPISRYVTLRMQSED